MSTIIFLDFDGTLLDVSERYSLSFKDAWEKLGYKVDISDSKLIEKIMQLRRSGTSTKEIVKIITNVEEEEKAFEIWKERINFVKHTRFDQDKFFPYVKDVLTLLKENELKPYIFLLTGRVSREVVKNQLEQEGIIEYFEDLLTVDPDHVTEEKVKVAESKIKELNAKNCYMVGDTIADIKLTNILKEKIGDSVKIHSIVVLTGIDGRETLQARNPDNILNNISELPPLVR